MNTDDFEKRLQRQSMRPIPREWRREILDAARRTGDPQLSTLRSKAAAEDGATSKPQTTSWRRELLWPCPQAWAGLAAAWMVILFLNMASREPVQAAKTSKAAPAPELLIALKEHRRLLADLIGTPTVGAPPKPFQPRPSKGVVHPNVVCYFP